MELNILKGETTMIGEIEGTLDELYLDSLKYLSGISTDSELFEKKMERVKELSKLRLDEKKVLIEQDKVNAEIELSGEKQEHDIKISKDRFEEDKKLKRAELGIELAAVVFPLIVYSKFVDKGFEMEKEGTYTSVTLKNLLQKFKPVK